MDLSNYNIHEVEPMGTFEPLPADWYRCAITIADTEERETPKRQDWQILAS